MTIKNDKTTHFHYATMNEKNNFYMGITLVMFFFKIILFIPHFLKQQKLHNSNCVHIILGNQQVSLQKNVCLLI